MIDKIIKFSASWCMPCKVFANTFHSVEEMDEYKDIKFEDIDIEKDENGDLMTEKYQVKSVPTTVLIDKDGNLIYKILGNIQKKDFIEIINQAQNK